MAITKNASFSDLIGTIRESPALLIASLAAIAAVIYIVYKSTQSQVGQPSTPANTQSPYYVAYVDETQNQPPPINVTVNNPGPPKPPGPPSPPSGPHLPGTTYKGPSGVIHYVVLGNETLGQIAAKFNTGTWNSIYAIPENQQRLGKLSATQLRTFKPNRGTDIVLPGNARLP